MLLNPKRSCPLCGATVSNSHPVGRPYKCVGCGALLQDRRRQAFSRGAIDLGAALVACWLLGFRGWVLAGMAPVMFVVILLLSVPLWEKVWPIGLEPWDGRRVI